MSETIYHFRGKPADVAYALMLAAVQQGWTGEITVAVSPKPNDSLILSPTPEEDRKRERKVDLKEQWS